MSALPFDPRYVAARTVLLDALEALPLQRPSLILVGAQAIYLRVDNAGIDDVVAHTLDADLAIAPDLLVREPALGGLLSAAGFVAGSQPGTWTKAGSAAGTGVFNLDLLVPAAVANSTGRAARLDGLGTRDARSTRGLEAVLVDRSPMTIRAIDPADDRSFELKVAGAAALLVAKMHKFGERIEDPNPARQKPLAKDALDVHRLLRGERPQTLAGTLRTLLAGDPATARVVRHALEVLRRHFAAPGSRGAQMAATAGQLSNQAAELPRLTATFALELLNELAPPR